MQAARLASRSEKSERNRTFRDKNYHRDTAGLRRTLRVLKRPMNYEAGTEERKRLTKCLNFKWPETILGVQAAPLLANIYTDSFFFRVYHKRKTRTLPSYRDPPWPVQLKLGEVCWCSMSNMVGCVFEKAYLKSKREIG